MKLVICIFLNLFLFVGISNSNDDSGDPFQLLNEKQRSLYFGVRNCESKTDQCLFLASEFYKEMKSDKLLSNTWLHGWSKHWYADTLLRHNKKESAFEQWEGLINDKIFENENNYEYKVFALISLGWIYFTDIDYLDDKKSFIYTKEAAEYGNSQALNNLGVFYQMGRNTKKNLFLKVDTLN